METQDKAKVYVVLGLSIDDAIQLDEWDENADHRYEKLYSSLNDEQRQQLADYLGEWMYDGDRWEEALRCGLDNLAKEQ